MNDFFAISKLKGNTLQSLEKRLLPNYIYYLGFFQNPPFKELGFLSAEQKDHEEIILWIT